MNKACVKCNKQFEVTEADLKFLNDISPVFSGKKYEIPPPTHCPSCRLHRRLIFRCHTAVFQRTSFPEGKKILSMYPESANFPVMDHDIYFNDGWDPCDYGQDVDFSRPFFEQFAELNTRVPKYARISIRNDNCDYCNNVSDNKNCYLVFATSNAEDCYYGENVWGSKDCLDCTNVLKSERCYDCTNCDRCYDLQSSEYSENCSESFYLAFCRNVKNCFGCVNLRNAQYCIWNEQKTKEEYEAFINAFQKSSWQEREQYRQWFEEFMTKHPRPHTSFIQTEDCNGNFLYECRKVTESSFIEGGENLKHCLHLYEGANNCMDHSLFGRRVEWTYECCSCGIDINNILFTVQGRDASSNLLYCYGCDGTQNSFGCISLKKKKHCILNKQYSKEEYEELVPRIIEHMKTTGEWGEFFPMQLSPIPYNRSLAQRYFPMSREEVEQNHFVWYEDDPREFPGAIEYHQLPDGLPETSEPITVKSASGRPYRIIEQEIKMCKKLQVPLPRMNYEERLDQRAAKLGGLELYSRKCAKTGKDILTTYPPNSPYPIWDREEYEQHFN